MGNPRFSLTTLLLSLTVFSSAAAPHVGHDGPVSISERALFARSPFHRARSIEAAIEHSIRITTESGTAQVFFDQGMALFIAGWPREAERAFLTARQLDAAAAMPRWGVALSHLVRDPLAALPELIFFEENADAVARLPLFERLAIDALPSVTAVEAESDWRRTMIERLRSAIALHPSEPELKAILACLLADGLHAWRDVCGETRDSTLALIQETIAAIPNHPVRRVGLQLWANELRHDPYHSPKPYFDPSSLQLSSVFPAHWNLSGRYLAERGQIPAALQHSEMASRIYHRWSVRQRCPPDRFPGYPRHRLVQGEQFRTTGNAAATLSIAHDLLRLPRHPVWNAVTNGFGSAFAGRKLLLESCLFFGLWEELSAALADGRIAALRDPVQRAEHLFALGVAAWFQDRTADFNSATERLAVISRAMESEFRAREEPGDDDAHHGSMLRWLLDGGEDYLSVTDWHRSLNALRESRNGHADAAALMLSGSRRVPSLLRARLLWSIGRHREAGQALLNADDLALPLRVQAMQSAARNPRTFPVEFTFTPASDRRSSIEDPAAPARMGLSSWQPPPFPAVELPLLDGGTLDSLSLRGRHTVLIFVYSSTCAHCLDQLAELRRQTAALSAADLDVVVIAGEPANSLAAWLEHQEPFPARFVADPDEQLFRIVGAYHDFNEMPLHATIYIDPAGRELWKDIGYEPFMDIGFFIAETRRLRQAYPANRAD